MVDLIRDAQVEDLPFIYELMADFDMFGIFSEDGCVVFERDSRICGFARIEMAEERYYLRPIVVAQKEQGSGVGKALLRYVRQQFDELIVIARGSAAGFYSQAGFRELDWDDIYDSFVDECKVCPDLFGCEPIPMKFVSS